MEKNQLLYVTAAAKHKNITKAAEELYISQPSLSNQIIKLEDELGIKLFERKKHRVELTEAGQVFVDSAQLILNSFGKLEELMGEYASMNKGSINIGLLPVITSMKIPDYLYEFQNRFPNIDIKLLEAGSSALINLILKKEIDVAFAILSDSALEKLKNELNIVQLRKDKIVVVVSEGHRLASKKHIDISELAGERLIFSNDNFQFPNIIINHMKSKQIHYTISARCTQLETTFALVAKNFGITLCSELTAGKKMEKEVYNHLKLQSIMLTPTIERTIYLLSNKNIGYHPASDNFVRFIREKYGIKNLR